MSGQSKVQGTILSMSPLHTMPATLQEADARQAREGRALDDAGRTLRDRDRRDHGGGAFGHRAFGRRRDRIGHRRGGSLPRNPRLTLLGLRLSRLPQRQVGLDDVTFSYGRTTPGLPLRFGTQLKGGNSAVHDHLLGRLPHHASVHSPVVRQ